LLEDGQEVIGLDNLSTGRAANLRLLQGRPEFRFFRHDICEPFQADGPIDVVYNLACPASPRDYLAAPIETLAACSEGARNMLELAVQSRARFLQASTSEAYGDALVQPQPETYWGNVNPVGPRAVYDEAKRYAEAMTMAYHRAHGLDTRIVRIFNTYGTRMRPRDGRVVSNFIVQGLRGEAMTIYGTGSQTRSFCHVDDQVEGIVRVYHCRRVDPINLGNPDEYTILELAALVMEETESQVPPVFRPLPPDDPVVRCPDISTARRELDWSPTIGLREGVRRTIPYFRGLIDGE